MSICTKCDKQIKASECKVCAKCKSTFHYQCVGIAPENFSKESKTYKASWRCIDCRRVDVQTQDSESSVINNIDDFKHYFDKKLEDSLSRLLVDIRRDFTIESTDTRNKIIELTECVNLISAKYDTVKKELDSTTKVVSNLQAENRFLRTEVSDLSSRLNRYEQQSRENNLEIQCVPEYRSENLKTVVRQLASTISCNLADNEVVNYHRVAKVNQESTRPRSIIVKLSSPLVRDTVLAAVKKYNKTRTNDKLNSSNLGIAGDKRPVYVCEHLSPANKQLYAAARKAAKDKLFEFVWVRGGRIHMRKDVNSKSFVVTSIEHLNSL